MKRNINLMQNGIDIENDSLNELQKEYILQALANLGQRIGIKGDGISYRNFNFLDLLNNENISYNVNEHIGWLKYQKLNDELVAIFGITNIDNDEDIVLTNINTKNINDVLYASNEIQFTIPINNIEKYSKNSIISNDGNILTIITVGKLLGYEDVDENNGVLLYYKFDLNTNKPIYIAKIGYVSSDNSSNYYYALELDRAKDNEGVYINNEYELNIKIFDSKSLGIYTDTFNELFMYSNHNNGEDLGFAFLRKDFIDLNNFKAYHDDLNNNYDSNSPLSVIMNSIASNNYYASSNLKLYINSEANEFLYSNNDELRNIISLYRNEYDFIDIEEELYNFNNDITDLYRNFLIYYNDKFFIENRSQFIKRILCELYEKIISESESKEYYKMYIPLTYELSYVCNSNNELNIYWSNDIYVLLSNLNSSNKHEILHKNNYIIFDYNEIDKVHSYRFEINYNKKYDNVINSINIRKIYSMPYVDADETWNINGSSTSIRAVGKDAGNPNIIIIYSKNKELTNENNSYEIINSISNKDFSSLDFIREQFEIDNSLFTHISTEKIYCYAWLPKITEYNKELFENSIILNICDLNCLESPLIKDYYLGSNILTLWYYTVENNTYKFKLITKNDKAMPLGVTENLESIINSTTLLDINEQELLILKAEIESLGQETLTNSNKKYGIIKNKKGSEYNEDYNNDLNTIIQYTNNLEYEILNDRKIANYDQVLTNKFIENLENLGRNNITNVLYPKYIETIETKDIETEEQVNELINKLQTTEVISINIDDDKFLVDDQIYDVIKQSIKRKQENKITQVSTKVLEIGNNNYYDEYIFNDNVPTIDFKEIFVRNINTLNKYNVLSLDEEGKIYYGYLGSSYDETDKSTLHIGTLTKNINIGTDTLINNTDINTFNKYNKLSLDFDNILLNAGKTLASSVYPYFIKKIKNNDGTYDEYKVGKYWILDRSFDNIYTYNDNPYNTNKMNDIMDNFENDNTNFNILSYIDVYDHFYKPLENQYDDKILDTPILILNHNENTHYLVCINYILYNIFNISLKDKYNSGKIIVNVGSNKLILVIKNVEGNDNPVPLFFIKINDPSIVQAIINDPSIVQDIDNANDTIWSTDTLDLLIHEYVEKYNGDDKNVISIFAKFDKYNLTGADRYVVWDFNNTDKYKIFPDQDSTITNMFIRNLKAESKDTYGNELKYYNITSDTNIVVSISYDYCLEYTYTNNEQETSIGEWKTKKITKVITLHESDIINSINNYENDHSVLQLNDQTLITNITVPVGELTLTNDESDIVKVYNDVDCKVKVLYTPNDWIIPENAKGTYCTTNELEADGLDHDIMIYNIYDVRYQYNDIIEDNINDNIKENILTVEKTTPYYSYTVNATNDSSSNSKIVLIPEDQNHKETWHYINNKEKEITIPQQQIIIKPFIDTSRNGYYYYIGKNIPNIETLENIDLKTIELASNKEEGWRYLIDDLTNFNKYDNLGNLTDYNEVFNFKYIIREIREYDSPYSSENVLYIIAPNGTILLDPLGNTITQIIKAGSFSNRSGEVQNKENVIYDIYRINMDVANLNIVLSTSNTDEYNIGEANPLQIMNWIQEKEEGRPISIINNSDSWYPEEIENNGNITTIYFECKCLFKVKYENNLKPIDIEKQYEFTYQINTADLANDQTEYILEPEIKDIIFHTYNPNTENFKENIYKISLPQKTITINK